MSQMRVTATLPAGRQTPIAVRPYGRVLSVQLGELSVCITPEQARRLLGQLGRQLATGATR